MSSRVILLFKIIILSLLTFNSCLALTYDVDSTEDFIDSNVGDGVCLTEFNSCTLRAAIQEANSIEGLDTINIPAGTYILNYGSFNENLAAEGDLDITDYVHILGEDPATTIIDGNVTDRIFHIRIQNYPSQSEDTNKISNLTLQNGLVDRNSGGAIYNEERLVIDNVHFLNNSITNDGDNYFNGGSGGAIFNDSWDEMLVVQNSRFSTNLAIKNGGAISSGSDIIISNSRFQNNQASNGGAIYSNGIFENLILENNIASENGGGIYGSGDFSQLNLTENNAIQGGGIFFLSFGHIRSSLMYNNSASEYGAGIYFSSRSYCCSNYDEIIEIDNTTISNNTATLNGGGIYINNIDNSNSNNSSTEILLTNVTIYGNSSDNSVIEDSAANIFGKFKVRNSIVANPSTGNNCGHVQSSLGFNIESGTSCGFTSINDLSDTDPLLNSISDGSNHLRTHAPQESSPAIDSAANSFCPLLDQRLFIRNGENCDIGAHEVEAIEGNIGVFNFVQDIYLINQSDTTEGIIEVSRTDGSVGRVEIEFDLTSGASYLKSNDEDTDYLIDISESGTLVWEDGDTDNKSISFSINATYTSSWNSEKELHYEITSSQKEINIGEKHKTGLKITVNSGFESDDNNDDSVGRLSWSRHIRVDENAENASIDVSRVFGSFGEISLKYRLVPFFATEGIDYENVSGEITWADGEDGDKTINVPIIDNENIDGKRRVDLELYDISGTDFTDLHVEEMPVSRIEIYDNEEGEQNDINFSSLSYEFTEGQGVASIKLLRDNSSGRAQADLNFESYYYSLSSEFEVSALITLEGDSNDLEISSPLKVLFEDGEAEKIIEFQINEDDIPELDEHVFIEITNVYGVANRSLQNTATLVILDNDGPNSPTAKPIDATSESNESGSSVNIWYILAVLIVLSMFRINFRNLFRST